MILSECDLVALERANKKYLEEKENEKMATKTTRKTKDELIKEIESLREEIKKRERMDQYDEGANEMKAVFDSFINAGFTREEAFELLRTAVKNAFNV